MNFKRSVVCVAMATAMGAGAALVPSTASAVLTDGAWALTIVPTATRLTSYGATAFKTGKDGAWNSSFTFGALPGAGSNGMTDNGTLVTGLGTSIAGDGFAGITELTVSGGAITVGGTSMVGSVDGAGNMSLTPTDRKGAINAPVLSADWNVDNFTDPAATAWQSFSTGSATAAAGTINGTVLTDAGDLDGDGTNDWTGVLVTGGQVGDQWGSFFGATYFEAWKVNILSGTAGSGFNVDTIFATAGGDFAQYTTAIPVPAAVWLFGSGLVGLVSVARRRKA